MANQEHINLKDLEVYRLARELSKIGWGVYKGLDWQTKKIIGDQYIRATDSVGANIAEGYSRYHYLDKIRFLYNSRASLTEAFEHWNDLLKERDLIKEPEYKSYNEIAGFTIRKLQSFISAIYKAKNKN